MTEEISEHLIESRWTERILEREIDNAVARFIKDIRIIIERSDETIRNRKKRIEIEQTIINYWVQQLSNLNNALKRVKTENNSLKTLLKILINIEDLKK